MKGFVKLSRNYFDNPLWKEDRTFSRSEAWLDLIASASIEDLKVHIKGQDIGVQRGEFAASNRFLQKRWNWSNTKVSNFLNYLKKNGMIKIRNDTGNTILTLIKYRDYNDKSDTKSDTEATPKRQSKEFKELKEIKNTPKGVKAKRFECPTIEMLESYFLEKTNDSEFSKKHSKKFFYHYDSKNWMIGKTKMKNWKSSVSGWINRQEDFEKEKNISPKKEKITASQALENAIHGTSSN